MLFRRLKGRTVIINMTNGDAFQGTVLGGWWVLRLASATFYPSGRREGDTLNGTVRVPARVVQWIQEA